MHILPATLVNLSNCSHYYGKHAWKASRNPRKRSAFPSEGDAGKRSLGKESVQIQVIDNKKAQLGLPSCWAWEDGAFVFKKHLDFSTSAKVPAPLKPCVSRPRPQQRKTLSPKPLHKPPKQWRSINTQPKASQQHLLKQVLLEWKGTAVRAGTHACGERTFCKKKSRKLLAETGRSGIFPGSLKRKSPDHAAISVAQFWNRVMCHGC